MVKQAAKKVLQAPWSGTAGGKEISSKAAGEKLQKKQLNSERNMVKTQARNPSAVGVSIFDLNADFV